MGRVSPRIFQAAVDGDAAALDQVAAAWLPEVYRWCHRLAGPRCDAEDAAHEVLILVCDRMHRVRSPEQFPSWLFGITRRVVANHRRRAWFRKWVPGATAEPQSDWMGPERTHQAKQAADEVWAALDSLAAQQREVLVLCELEDLSAGEASELIGVPVGTVKSRLRAARVAFRGAVESKRRSASALEVV